MESRRLLAVVNVNTFDDTVDAADGLTSLREAIVAANNATQATRINLPNGTYTLTRMGLGENAGLVGDLDIQQQVTLIGNGSTIDASALGDRAFHVAPGANATFQSLVVSGGTATETGAPATVSDFARGGGILSEGTSSLTNTELRGNSASEGGALYQQSGLLILATTNVVDNVASGASANQGGGGLFNNGGRVIIQSGSFDNNRANGIAGSGGGIFNGPNGTLVATDTQLVNNTAARAGGGIENASNGGFLILRSPNITDNTAGPIGTGNPGNGGGLHVTGNARIQIDGGTISDNAAAAQGGGIWNDTGTLTIIGTTLSQNEAIGNGASDGGGGIFNNGGLVTLQNGSQVTLNEASGTEGSGGGILNAGGGTVRVLSGLIANNVANRAGGGIESRDNGRVVVIGATISQNNAGFAPATANPGNGGGIHVTGGGTLRVVDSTLSMNIAADQGGGIWNDSGHAAVSGSAITGNTAAGSAMPTGGGGIYNDSGLLTVTGGSISGNTAEGAGGSGGGIYNSVGGTVSVHGTTITGNAANRAGGGIEHAGTATGNLRITGATISNNLAGAGTPQATPGNGGGINIDGDGNALVFQTVVSGNQAQNQGGGIWNGMGTLRVAGTSLSGNSIAGTAPQQGGGGIFNGGGLLVVTGQSILDNNTDNGMGSGILNMDGTLRVTYSTIRNHVVGIGHTNAAPLLVDTTFDGNTTDVLDLTASPSPQTDSGESIPSLIANDPDDRQSDWPNQVDQLFGDA